MGVNKVVLANGDVLVDMSAATVTPETLGEGATAFNAAGDLITGTMAGGGGTDVEDGIIMRTIEGEYVNDRVTMIGAYAFRGCTSLTEVDFPEVTMIGAYAFYDCTSLTEVDFPEVTSIGNDAFYKCTSLTEVDFPQATSVGSSAFYDCTSLAAVDFPQATSVVSSVFRGCTSLAAVDFPQATSVGGSAFYGCTSLPEVDFPQATSVGSSAFRGCTKLETLILRSETKATLSNTNALTSTPIASGTGYIYVPASLVDAYKAATNWVTYADQFRAIEDYPEITGGTTA